MIQVAPNDILPGKGKHASEHHGNKQFRGIVEKYVKEYHHANSNASKRTVTNRVRQDIKNLSPPGRFLEGKNDAYYEQAEKGIDARITQAFRDRLKKIRGKNTASVSPSTTTTASTPEAGDDTPPPPFQELIEDDVSLQ